MASNCSICNNKIGIMEPIGSLSEEYPNIKVCNKCLTKRRELFFAEKDKEKYFTAIEYFKKYQSSEQLNSIVSSTIDAWVKYGEQCFNENIEEQERKEKEQELLNNLDNFMITNGDSFEGYRIQAYHGLVSGETVLGTGFLSEYSATFADYFGTKSKAFANKIFKAKQAAQIILMQNAIHKGANAVIGVNYGYITFDGNVIGISADGTAVEIEKENI